MWLNFLWSLYLINLNIKYNVDVFLGMFNNLFLYWFKFFCSINEDNSNCLKNLKLYYKRVFGQILVHYNSLYYYNLYFHFIRCIFKRSKVKYISIVDRVHRNGDIVLLFLQSINLELKYINQDKMTLLS